MSAGMLIEFELIVRMWVERALARVSVVKKLGQSLRERPVVAF